MIYVASKCRHAHMWRSLRDEEQFPINSTWIDEAEKGQTQSYTELWMRIDREIKEADAFVLYVHPADDALKGAFVEVGIALALGKPVYAVHPGVILDEHLRPIGSWLKHPNVVSHMPDVKTALQAITGK